MSCTPYHLLIERGERLREEGRRIVRDWKRTVNIKDLIDPSQPADVVADSIRVRLVHAFGSPDFVLADIITDFGTVGSAEECDGVLDRLYDWADDNDVWLGLK